MNAVDKDMVDQFVNESDNDEEVVLRASSIYDDDFEFLNRAARYDYEDADSDLDGDFEDFENEDSEFFEGITGLNEPRRPYGRWLNNKKAKSLHSKHRHRQYGWAPDDEDDLW